MIFTKEDVLRNLSYNVQKSVLWFTFSTVKGLIKVVCSFEEL